MTLLGALKDKEITAERGSGGKRGMLRFRSYLVTIRLFLLKKLILISLEYILEIPAFVVVLEVINLYLIICSFLF